MLAGEMRLLQMSRVKEEGTLFKTTQGVQLLASALILASKAALWIGFPLEKLHRHVPCIIILTEIAQGVPQAWAHLRTFTQPNPGHQCPPQLTLAVGQGL